MQSLRKAIYNRSMSKSPPSGLKLSFKARLEEWAEGMDYCAVPVPPKITKALGTKGPVLVMTQVNESEFFKASLFPVGGGQHWIRIKAKVRKETKTKTGDWILLRMIVLDRADVVYPKDLLSALRMQGATKGFKSLPSGQQNFLVRRIEEVAKPETRRKRVQEAVAAAHQRREKIANRVK